MVAHQVAVHVGLRRRLYEEMEPSARARPGLSRANTFIVLLVLLSFALFALETEPTIGEPYRGWINILNVAVLVAFAFEYLTRLWIVGEDARYRGLTGRTRYVLSPWALADLAAFLPELVWVLSPNTAGSDDMLMFLRVLRLIRLIKIVRFVPAFRVLGVALRRAGGQLLTALAVALALVFVSAVLLYFIEGLGEGREEFGSIPRSIWWAVATLTTVGYGDIYPITVGGRIAAGFVAIAGIGVVALPAGIFASAFADELREREKIRRQEAMQALTARIAAVEHVEEENLERLSRPASD